MSRCESCGQEVREGLTEEDRRAIVADLLAALREYGVVASAAQPHSDSGYWATAEDVARRIDMSAAWVRANADALGAARVGSGRKPRLRFNVEVVDERMAAMRRPPPRAKPQSQPPRSSQRRRRPEAGGLLLPVKGRRVT